MAFFHDGITLFPQFCTYCNPRCNQCLETGYLPLDIGQIPTLAVTTTASFRPSSYGLDWNWVWFSKLELEFIFLKNQTLNQIPGSIYAWNWNQDSFFFFFFFVGGGGGVSEKSQVITPRGRGSKMAKKVIT